MCMTLLVANEHDSCLMYDTSASAETFRDPRAADSSGVRFRIVNLFTQMWLLRSAEVPAQMPTHTTFGIRMPGNGMSSRISCPPTTTLQVFISISKCTCKDRHCSGERQALQWCAEGDVVEVLRYHLVQCKCSG